MWRELIEDGHRFELVEVARSGASGPKVIIAVDTATGKKYAIKYGEPEQLRVPLLTQVANRQRIAPLFGEKHFPPVIMSGPRVIMMPALEGETFHDAVIRGTFDLDYLFLVFREIVGRFKDVWTKTAKPFDAGEKLARDPRSRIERVQKAVWEHNFNSFRLASTGNLAVVVNGERLPPLEQLFAKMKDLYAAPKDLIFCHGDPNADNIIIDPYGYWWLVDWEWVGWHDWRVIVSHFIGWWHANAAMMMSGPKIEVDGEIKLAYTLQDHPLVAPLVEFAWQFAEEMGEHWSEAEWQKQVQLQLATFLLGDIRFLEARGRPNHAIPLLGEGLKLLAAL